MTSPRPDLNGESHLGRPDDRQPNSRRQNERVSLAE